MNQYIKKFPSGLTIERAKSRAKLVKQNGEVETLTEALDLIAFQEMGLRWSQAIKIINNHFEIDDHCDEWVFIKLSSETAMLLHLWTRHHYKARPDLDSELEKKLEDIIPLAIANNHLQYNEKLFGKFCLKLGKFFNGSDGMLMPKVYFKDLPSDIKILSNPKAKYS